jgi:serine/threonine protein kinase
MMPRTQRAAAALVVGVSRYPHPDVATLQFARRDARSMARALTDPVICNFPVERVALLTDDRASRKAVVDHLANWLPQNAAGSEVVLIYFAGHGMVHLTGPRQEGYLLPHDADPDAIAASGIPMSDVARWVEAIDARAVVVCLDCCHAGKVTKRQTNLGGGRGGRDMRLRPSVLPGLTGEGRFLIASCGEDQVSIETHERRHGLFTWHLLQGLRGAADRDRDGRVGVAELFEHVAEAVEREAREKYGQAQRPWKTSTDTGGVYLSAPAVQAPAGPAGGVPGNASAALHELETRLADADESELISLLRVLRKKPDPASLPVLFRCLCLSSEEVKRRALLAIEAIGWPAVVVETESLVRQGDERAGAMLEGLAAFEATAEVVALLDRLVVLLRDGLRERALHLLGRKRLGLDLEKTRALLEQFHCPFAIERPLGQGLFTDTYLARHTEADGMQVVVRVLRQEFAAQAALRGLYYDLGRQALTMVHQNLVQTLDVRKFPEDGIYLWVRGHVKGVTLQKLLSSSHAFKPPQVVAILRQVADGLTPWHDAGLVHAGVTPPNLFVREDNRLIVGDPGLPLRMMPPGHERLAHDCRYAAPEQFLGGAVITPAADQYALGCIAWELLCGRTPFVSDNYLELATRHAQEPVRWPVEQEALGRSLLGSVVLRLLAKEPANRFPGIGALLEALDRVRLVLSDQPVPTEESGRTQHPDPRKTLVPPVELVGPESLDDLASVASIIPGREGAEPGPATPPEEPGLPPATLGASTQPIHSAGGRPRPPAQIRIPGYEVLEELGRGGMGVVYKARQVALDRLVALKMLLHAGHASEATLERFSREARIIAQLRHPNIIAVFDASEHDGVPFLAMELATGSLREQLRGPMTPDEAAALVETLARAIHHAHEYGIIHRDLKPANVLLTADGTPKIGDFGLGKKLDEMGQTTSGAIMGTPSYLSPELASGRARDVGPATDIYSLGAILYECLTGRPPFQGASMPQTLMQVVHEEPVSPRELNPQVPRELEMICLKCLRKAPGERYPGADALAEELCRFRQGEPIQARPVGWSGRVWRRCRRNPAVAALVLAVPLGAAVAWVLLR